MTKRHLKRPAPEDELDLLRAAFDRGPCPCVAWQVDDDAELRCLAANRKAVAIGIVPSEFVPGQSAQQILRPSTLQGLKNAYAEVTTTGGQATFEEVFDVAGRDTWWRVSLDVIEAAKGRPRRLLGSWVQVDSVAQTELALHQSEARFQTFVDAAPERDVTERRELQARLAMADRMISLGTLAAGVAHEVNNPLAYVHGNLQWVLSQLRSAERSAMPPDYPEIMQALGEALLGADRVRRIALDLKRLSRPQNEELGPVDVTRVLESVINVASSEIRWRAQLVRDFAQVPAVWGTDARLGQLFLNLILNATEAIAPGAIDANEVRITTREIPGRVEVEVSDTGAGIAPHLLGRVFDPFFTTKPAGVGTGLGLSICRSIVAGFGGELTVESELDKGSTFRVVLPAARVAPVKDSVEEPLPEIRARILIVDDEELVGNALRRMLYPAHQVMVVRSAREALSQCEGAEPPDVVVCDVVMPEMTGVDFYRALSSAVPRLQGRVIFVTGGALSGELADQLERTSAPVLQKPIDWKLLDAALRTMLASERSHEGGP